MSADYRIILVDYQTVKGLIVKLHYAKRAPRVSHYFGLFYKGVLTGVATYGQPATPWLCVGICGEKWRHNVLELSRLVLVDNRPNEASYLIGNSLKMLPKPSIVVSYADTAWNHIGYIYQATNWLYTGTTQDRTDIKSRSGHARHYISDKTKRQRRSVKHRYVYFVGTKRQVRNMMSDFRYCVLPYPKGDSERHDTGKLVGLQSIMFLGEE